MKQAVILAGGKGTRLRERLGDRPKPLVDICGAPLLQRQIALLKQHSFTHALVLVNHGADQIVRFLSESRHWRLDIECIDDGDPRGTAGATVAAYDRLSNEFLVMYGDTMLDVDLGRFHVQHSQFEGTAATLLLHPNDHPHDSDLVEVADDGRILAFHPYPHDASRYYPNLVNAALYWINKQALEPWRGRRDVLDFGKNVFPAMLEQGLVLRGYKSPEYIKDIGTPTRLDKVCADFRSGKIARANLGHSQCMVFVDRDGTINRHVGHLHHREQFRLLPGVAEAVKRLNGSDYRCCVITNQPVLARGECSHDELRAIHNKMETLLGQQGAFIDGIYYCPHHPDRGFVGERTELKIECDCRKPKTGMIERAAREFNVDAGRSWLIGDSSVDIETARRANLRSILVETGFAGLDDSASATPYAIVPDLGAAVGFILDLYPRVMSFCTRLATAVPDGAVVFIGGHSRSGKSTFASVLRDAFRSSGRNAAILPIDRWLKNESERGPGVLNRYDLKALEELVDALGDADRRPLEIALAGYDKLRRARVDRVEEVSIQKLDVVIIEGTVALALDVGRRPDQHRFHVEIDEEVRKTRVLSEYRLRGYDENEALQTYLSRQADEFPIIERLSASARRIRFDRICLGLAD